MNEPDIAPLARRLAEENNVDWRRLPGSGDGGRVVERDVLTFLARVMAGEEDLDPTPEPVPDGMAAWPDDDVAAYRAGPAGGDAAERSTTATLDDDDLFLFDDDPVVEATSAPRADAGRDGFASDAIAASGSHDDPFAGIEEDDEGVLLVDEESVDDARTEPSTGFAAFTFDDVPAAPHARRPEPDGGSLPDVFADDGAVAGQRDDDVLFLDDPIDVDAPAARGDERAPSAREPWAAWDGEADVSFGRDGADDEDRRTPFDGDAVLPAAGAARSGARDDAWAHADGPSVPAEPESGAFAQVPDLPRPAGNGDAAPTARASSGTQADRTPHETAFRPIAVPTGSASGVDAMARGGVTLVRHGQLWRRRFDDRSFRSTVSQVADALDVAPVIVAEVLLARAAAMAWSVGDVDAWRWAPSGAVRCALEAQGSLRDALAAASADPDPATSTERTAALVVADLATMDLDEAVVHLDAPLLAIGRGTQDGAWLTLSGDEVPAEAVAALAAVAETLKAPVRLLL